MKIEEIIKIMDSMENQFSRQSWDDIIDSMEPSLRWKNVRVEAKKDEKRKELIKKIEEFFDENNEL